MSEVSKAVFLSYASQDAEAARKICEALRSAGVEVWFDQSELRGGDAWDAKIRGQIATCALFVPVISVNTQARLEGYFRLEWKLAGQRTHTMADEKAFLLPVVIDRTRDAEAKVPAEFRAVQWTRLRDGETSPAFIERVKFLLDGEGLARASQPMSTEPSNVPHGLKTRPTSVPRKRSGLRRWAALAAVLAIGATVTFIATRTKETSPPTNPKAQAPNSKPLDLAPAKSIAVLAFANMSPDKDTEYFSDGISEEILNALDRIPALRVTPRTSSFSFKGRNVALDEIGRALRVSNVIEGSVRKAGNKVRITVKLLNAADGTRVWAEDFERDMTDIFAVQGEIAAKVAQKLNGAPTTSATSSAAPAGAQTKNLAAYDAYLRGRAEQLGTAFSIEAATLFEEAVRLDPDYALAWARLAQALTRLRGLARFRTEENESRARSAAAMAVRLSPELPEAHLALAAVEREAGAIQRALDTVERLRPGDAELLAARANLDYSRGNWGADFARLVGRAVERDPQNYGTQSVLGRALSNTGWYSHAAQLLEQVRATSRDEFRLSWFLTVNTLRWTGDVKAALADLELTPPDARGDAFLIMRAALHVQSGNLAAALAECEKIGPIETLRRGGIGRHSHAYFLALIESRLGRAARAAEILTQTLVNVETAEADPLRYYAAVPALVKARLGQQEEAFAALDEAMKPGNETNALMVAFARQSKAEVHAVLGQIDEAVATLRSVHDMGFGFGYTLRLDLEWEPLRSDRKFQQLMKETEARADAQPRPERPR